jgi:hypothetical protein
MASCPKPEYDLAAVMSAHLTKTAEQIEDILSEEERESFCFLFGRRVFARFDSATELVDWATSPTSPYNHLHLVLYIPRDRYDDYKYISSHLYKEPRLVARKG